MNYKKVQTFMNLGVKGLTHFLCSALHELALLAARYLTTQTKTHSSRLQALVFALPKGSHW